MNEKKDCEIGITDPDMGIEDSRCPECHDLKYVYKSECRGSTMPCTLCQKDKFCKMCVRRNMPICNSCEDLEYFLQV